MVSIPIPDGVGALNSAGILGWHLCCCIRRGMKMLVGGWRTTKNIALPPADCRGRVGVLNLGTLRAVSSLSFDPLSERGDTAFSFLFFGAGWVFLLWSGDGYFYKGWCT